MARQGRPHLFTKTDCIACLGRRGSGKSYLAKRIQKMYPRRVIFDATGEYDRPLVVHSFQEFGQELLAHQNAHAFEIVFRFDPERSELAEAEFDHALRACYYLGNVQVVVEEVQHFATAHYLPQWLRTCLLMGRHRGVSVMVTTQRPGELHKTILSQCAHIFAGQLHEKNDLTYVASFLGVAAEQLTHLPPEYFIYFRPGQPIVKIHNSLQGK